MTEHPIESALGNNAASAADLAQPEVILPPIGLPEILPEKIDALPELPEASFDFSTLNFHKGHGTENDFIILEDITGAIDLTPQLVAALADRRAGIGGDGVIRILRAGVAVDRGILEELPEGNQPEDWFMDYRNSDGSLAQMCGNGVRVFAHYLAYSGLEDATEYRIATRAGARSVEIRNGDQGEATVKVNMGPARFTGVSQAKVGDQEFTGVGVDMGNPHLACVVDGLDEAGLAALPVQDPVNFDPKAFPEGVNVEIVTPLEDGTVHMRVHERGVGETRSCGTGTVAAAWAALADAGMAEGKVTVNVPGGVVEVEIGDGWSTLNGPSRLVAEGTVDLNTLTYRSQG